jgi:4-hydroxy-tetrahydrodipicolinate synthase
MTPAYIKPTQQGLIEHYRYIAKETPIPIILYNVPSRTACDMQPETVKTLSQLSNIIAIKEATGQLDRLKKLISLECECDIFSGDDETAYEWMLNGAKGVISVTANVAPRLMSKLCEAALFDNQEIASAIQTQLLPLHQYLFKETNPIPVKWALSKLGKIHDELRLPLTSFSNAYHEQMMIILKQLAMV